MKTLILVFTILFSAPMIFANEPSQGFYRCEPPTSSPYRVYNAPQPLRTALIADWDEFSAQNFSGKTRSVLAVQTNSLAWDYIPVLLVQRGISRREFCTFKPFKIIFLDEKIEENIEAEFEFGPEYELNEEKLFAYYQKFLAATVSENQIDKKQKRNSFAKSSGKIKVVTHCGQSRWDRVGGSTIEEAREHLLSEYYIYKILETLETTVESVRLTQVTYYNSKGSKLYPSENDSQSYRYAFFREPLSRLAKRCGLSKKPGNDETQDRFIYELHFINRFINNYDYERYNRENVHVMSTPEGDAVYSPYDFDLSGIFDKRGEKNVKSTEEAARYLILHVGIYDKEISLPPILQLERQQHKIRSIIDNSLLSEERKKVFSDWFEINIRAISEKIDEMTGRKKSR